jgi:hypothetical protein
MFATNGAGKQQKIQLQSNNKLLLHRTERKYTARQIIHKSSRSQIRASLNIEKLIFVSCPKNHLPNICKYLLFINKYLLTCCLSKQ